MSNKSDLVFVGYTNGSQIIYAKEEGGEGSFYKVTDNECYIPLYMLRQHLHRLGDDLEKFKQMEGDS